MLRQWLAVKENVSALNGDGLSSRVGRKSQPLLQMRVLVSVKAVLQFPI